MKKGERDEIKRKSCNKEAKQEEGKKRDGEKA